jgi:UDP-N-acetylmuramoyl-L-alanyl-D-glutamate--2,6-diaminopimelate ligase
MFIPRIQIDSRVVQPGDLFVAVRGAAVDGHQFIADAAAKGASAVVYESGDIPEGITGIQVPRATQALAQLAAQYYKMPADQLQLIGITGTNGKTSTAHLVAGILRQAEFPTALLGTIAYEFGGQQTAARLTTPDALEIQKILRIAVDAGDTWCVMEASSHALAQDRLYGLEFDVAVFTNLSRDHLDYHGDLESYAVAKSQLFHQIRKATGHAVVNIDDKACAQVCPPNSRDMMTYGLNDQADLYPMDWVMTLQGVEATLRTPAGPLHIQSPLVGAMNVYNLLAAVGCGLVIGLDGGAISEGLAQCSDIPGRMERVQAGQDFAVFVDYAHTPDAVEQAVSAIRAVTTGHIITVLGCGGNRDTGKREAMGEISSRLADMSVLTSDNPRSEDPDVIIEAMLKGVQDRRKVHVEPDRRNAIAFALQQATPADVVLILGKGHEQTQTLDGVTVPFDDRAVAKELLCRDCTNAAS